MALNEEEIRTKLLAQLTGEERSKAILYASSMTIPSGKLKLALNEIDVPWEARLGFVDREPSANWGHSSRYILLNIKNGEVLSVESRFSPFQRNASLGWRTIYKAPSAPDWAVAATEE
jgi:hypothetical protein